MTMARALAIPALMRDEGKRLKPYRCTAGTLTIGFGRNLEDVGISDDEAMELLEHDVDACISDCMRVFPWFAGLDPVRQAVIINMRFNLGLARLLGFTHTLSAIGRGDYDAAADGMLASKWARQVGERADRLARQMRLGRVS